MKVWKMLIGSQWVGSQHGKTRPILNPATEKILAEVYEADIADVHSAVENARKAFEDGRWSRKSPGERALALMRLADKLEQNLKSLANLEMQNVGKPLKLVQDGDIPFAVDNLRFFASAARLLEGRSSQEYASGYTSIIRREPIGVVVLIAPWNYPFMMAVWKAAPALAAGNTLVLKPSEITPLTTLEFGRLALESGIPEGVINIVTGGEEVGVALTQHPDVKMISFTGDTETGKKILAQTAPTLKKCHMELGGKAPFVVFEDADLEAAVQGAVVASFVNTGQDCTAATRFYIQESLYRKFLEAFLKEVSKVRVGSPSSPDTDMGPLVSSEQRDRVEGFVKRALQEKARIASGGGRPKNLEAGFFFEPTVIVDVDQTSEIVQKEVFGPVVAVLPFKDEEEAIRFSNDVPYGLAASVWTKDIQRALRFSGALEFGTVWINDHLPLTSEMPHGGFKQSGFGKDLSLYALEEYTQIKHVMAETTGAVRKPWHYTVFGNP
ncbi:MAG: gamma-aminobutyraldehyde dehydrogenase [Elusimicrobia bacterium]|nr:gamma-aminobutyraldehyde dehydrogenase [Elusimicrobiota bacterium]